MATKVYGIPGRVTVEIRIPVGKAVLPLNFERGCLDRKNYRPATFSTSDKSIQDMIEGSQFYGKTIKLYKVYGSEEPEVKKPAKPSKNISKRAAKLAETPAVPYVDAEPTETALAANDELKVFPDVTNIEEARMVLKSLGAKATQLKESAIRNTMNQFGVSFPNYTE